MEITAADQALLHFLPGESAGIKELRERIAHLNRRVKQYPGLGRSVLLLGETGVGKNHIARVITAHAYLLDHSEKWPVDGRRPPTLAQLTLGRIKEVNLPSLPKE